MITIAILIGLGVAAMLVLCFMLVFRPKIKRVEQLTRTYPSSAAVWKGPPYMDIRRSSNPPVVDDMTPYIIASTMASDSGYSGGGSDCGSSDGGGGGDGGGCGGD